MRMRKSMIAQVQRQILMSRMMKVKKKTMSQITVIKGAVTNMKISVKKRWSLKVIAVDKKKKTVSRKVKKTHIMRKKVKIKVKERLMKVPLIVTP